MMRVGVLGCPDVDVESWKRTNRAPLYAGKINRWLLIRTMRDRPTENDVRETLYAVFNKWFAGSPIDPALDLPGEGGRAGPVDHITLVRASSSPISLTSVSRRREDLPEAPPPTVNAEGGLLYLEVHFACRALAVSLPWPVRTAPSWVGAQLRSSAECPVNADWMLSEVGKPLENAPPERPLIDVLAGKTGEVLSSAASATGSLLAPLFWPLMLGGFAFVGYLYITRRH